MRIQELIDLLLEWDQVEPSPGQLHDPDTGLYCALGYLAHRVGLEINEQGTRFVAAPEGSYEPFGELFPTLAAKGINVAHSIWAAYDGVGFDVTPGKTQRERVVRTIARLKKIQETHE